MRKSTFVAGKKQNFVKMTYENSKTLYSKPLLFPPTG
jgi:hypothetical protein